MLFIVVNNLIVGKVFFIYATHIQPDKLWRELIHVNKVFWQRCKEKNSKQASMYKWHLLLIDDDHGDGDDGDDEDVAGSSAEFRRHFPVDRSQMASSKSDGNAACCFYSKVSSTHSSSLIHNTYILTTIRTIRVW